MYVRLELAVLSAGLLFFCAGAPCAGPEFSVIVNTSNPTSVISRENLERAYRRHLRFWPDGVRILPVNSPFSNPLRRRFSRLVLHASSDSLATFWNRQYFQGILPPPVLKTHAAVRAYVAKTRGAIGYVPPDYVDETVRTIKVRYDD